MLVCGIESSCDETAISLVEEGHKVLSSLVASQIKTHARFGGVVPEVAAREHLQVIHSLFEACLEEAGKKVEDITAIAVTQGPGLVGSLLVGTGFARGLASASKKPLIPVNHVHAHVHGALLGLEGQDVFPCLALVVSGGHTNLYSMKSSLDFELLACTLDDACGECFDKTAKLLGLGFPGGPAVEKEAQNGQAGIFNMPKMAAHNPGAFSYSGLKTHILQLVKKNSPLSLQDKADMCYAFQDEALSQLVRKTKAQLKDSQIDYKGLLVAGGVAANKHFRKLLKQELSLPVFFPKLQYCSDNAAMIAALATAQIQREGLSEERGSWDVFARYPYEQFIGQPKNDQKTSQAKGDVKSE